LLLQKRVWIRLAPTAAARALRPGQATYKGQRMRNMNMLHNIGIKFEPDYNAPAEEGPLPASAAPGGPAPGRRPPALRHRFLMVAS
jgi:hypothetical protein